MRICRVGKVEIGAGRALAVIAGPCVLESLELGLEVGRRIGEECRRLGLSFIFKSSFDKANRSSIRSARGPGLARGLEWLSRLGEDLAAPVTTDIHEPAQARAAADAVDLIQIPSFLCRQTDLLVAAGEAAAASGRAVNVKKGQFLSPQEMAGAVRKVGEGWGGGGGGAAANVMVTERGTFFGYGRLVNDFIGLGDLMELDVPGGPPPVCFDCTHSTQLPGAGDQTGGRPERAALLARAATAAGVHALFLECHPRPREGISDPSTMLDLDGAAALLGQVARIRDAETR